MKIISQHTYGMRIYPNKEISYFAKSNFRIKSKSFIKEYHLVQVFADEIVDLSKTELFSMYGGERVPNYENSTNDYDCAVIVFSLENFLGDNYTKGFHYASIVNEIEEPNSEYNARYDEVFEYLNPPWEDHPDYGRRFLNPYHSSYKTLNFTTRLFEGTLGTNEHELNLAIKIYPNPTTDVVNIEFTNDYQLESLQIFSMQGQLLKDVTSTEIDIKELATGMYFLKIQTDNGIITKKIIKE